MLGESSIKIIKKSKYRLGMVISEWSQKIPFQLMSTPVAI